VDTRTKKFEPFLFQEVCGGAFVCIAMTTPAPTSRVPRLVWILASAAAVLLLAGAWLWYDPPRKGGEDAAAHVIALDAQSQMGWSWFAKSLETARSYPAGKTIRIPSHSRLRILWPDGRSEDVTGPAKIPVVAVAPRGETMENFLSVPFTELTMVEPTGTSASVGAVSIVSPVGVTRFTNPVMQWVARPDTDYDVAVVDPADPLAPPRLTTKVRPPLAFDQLGGPQKRNLQADRLHEVHVREAGSDLMIGLARFLVNKDAAPGALPTEPADLLREAAEAMAKKPTRTGDAWLALSRLPPEWAETELVLRLRLRVAAELGLVDEFVRAQESVWRTMKK
jgi:hypothetical protein